MQEAARAKGVQLLVLKAGIESDIDAAFASLVRLAAGGLVVGTDPFFTSRSELKGEKPADLPVQQPMRLELIVNLKTAKALGLKVPPSILARADEVID